ncbi:hypothetical protein GCM10010106_43290 [Thermopolyspora flexuosa]|nr:hypothetical protein GCM10010106_43290 [Thermopolyspora flexuosa]
MAGANHTVPAWPRQTTQSRHGRGKPHSPGMTGANYTAPAMPGQVTPSQPRAGANQYGSGLRAGARSASPASGSSGKQGRPGGSAGSIGEAPAHGRGTRDQGSGGSPSPFS